MPLQSALFRGDPKLEAAAVSDPAHIMKGAKGEHVRKIQQALVLLDKAPITPDGDYGGLTASAVLAYKQKRKIINFSYQTQADNIVGKMTMAALDKELVGAEQAPVLLIPVHPQPRLVSYTPRVRQARFVPGAPAFQLANAIELPPVNAPPGEFELIAARGTIGTIRVIGGDGGKVIRSQLDPLHGGGNNPHQVARFVGASRQVKGGEEFDIAGNDVIVSYETLNCGECTFRVVAGDRKSRVLRVLSLVERPTPMTPQKSDLTEDPKFPSRLLSKAGTPLKPKDGRRVNLFGEAETPGFEDYSSDLDFCTHNFSMGNGPAGQSFGHRPWTHDSRVGPGIANKSVMNICSRSSPIHPVTVNEILRIGMSKCRVTYAEAGPKRHSQRLIDGLGTKADVIEEGVREGGGYAVILELK